MKNIQFTETVHHMNEKKVKYVRVSEMTRKDIEKLKAYIKLREVEFLMEDLKMCSGPETCSGRPCVTKHKKPLHTR